MPTGAWVQVGNTAQGGCRAGAAALHRYLIYRWGDGVGSFGCYNPNSRAGSGWSLHREGRAIDVSVASSVKYKGDEIFAWCIANADHLGLQEIQWYGRIWTSRKSSQGIRTDTSAARNLHFDHIHVGLAYGWSFTPPGGGGIPGGGGTPPPQQGVEDMAQVPQEEWNEIRNKVREIDNTMHNNVYGVAMKTNSIETLAMTRKIRDAIFNNTFGVAMQNITIDTWQKVGAIFSRIKA